MSGRGSSQEQMTGRIDDSTLTKAADWLLLRGGRVTVALGFAGLLLAFFAVFSATGLAPMTDVQSLFYAYSALVGGNITLITVVVSLNQLLLSRELQTPGEVRSQIDNAIDYRSEVEAVTGKIAPVEPVGFLQLLVEGAREEAQRLGGLARDDAGQVVCQEIDDEVAEFTAQMDHIDALLKKSGGDTVEVLAVLLETNYARDINHLRQLKDRHAGERDEATASAIDDLTDRLLEIDVARQFFKTLYLEQELSLLSRRLVYVGIPVVALGMASLLLATVPPDRPWLLSNAAFVPVTLAAGALPLLLLGSYTLRIATVTKLTAATLPFTTPEQER